MNRPLLFAITLLLISSARAQVIMPAKYDSSVKINFVRTWEPVKPYTSEADVISSSRTLQEVRQSTSYFDGMGKGLQTVIRRGSLVTGDTARDMVLPVVYDGYGRETYKYLPFAANNTGSNNSISDGKFKLNPFQQDSTFNKGMFVNENYYYGKIDFESSPGSRVSESYSPGDSWVGTASQSNESDRHGTKIKYYINTTTDSVRVWTVTDVANSFGTYSTSAIYAAATLYKTISQDEHNNQIIEFKDIDGKTLLKKVQLTATADTGNGKNHTGWLCTYYIYDDMNNLRCVVQPKGVELLASNSWSMTYASSIILNEQCFRYEYDSKRRLIMKKIPGAETVSLIYDARDRVIMIQDSALKALHKWMYTQYDAKNRDIATGLITDDLYYNDPSYHRNHADTSIIWPILSSYTNDELTKVFYDNYGWRNDEGNPLSASRSNSYDSYLLSPSSTVWPYPESATAQSSILTGLVTGTKRKILGANTYLYTVYFYSDKGNLIQTQGTNQSGGTDITVTQYSWSGNPLISINKHEKSGTNSQTSIVVTKMTYDDLFRLIKTEKKISSTKVNSGSMPGSWTIINEHEYNALGRLLKKKLGTTPLETLNYEYNIRGSMLGMNRVYVKDTTSTANWFGFDLGYDKTSFTVNGTSHGYTAAQYNGNINGMLWRSTGDDYLRKYDFTYDAANRFLSADFNQLNSNSFNKASKIDFSVSGMSYDANGNIASMKQTGWKLGGSVTIDSLTYSYVANTNRLLKVIDGVSDQNTRLGDFHDGSNESNDDYTYNSNGNLASDANKKISLIHYNHLNLPDSIRITGKGIIKYTYDAEGNKIQKTIIDSTTSPVKTTITLYLTGNYVNDTLQFLSTEEGRARIKDDASAIVYDYMIKDHLGNVRMILTEETKTDAYPSATMETATATTEEIYYSNLPATRVDPPGNYPFCDFCLPNYKVAKVNGGGNKIGPAIILKVMAGDKFNLVANSWWKSNLTPGSPVNPLSDLLSQIGTNASAITGGHPSSSEITNSTELNNAVASFLNSQSYNSSRPKAYLNWVLLDERFNYVPSSSGFIQVSSSNTFSTHVYNDMPVDKSGYLYVYVSNATSNIDVYFDNINVTHVRGPLMEENHYYPWGLAMAGISSKSLAFGKENRQKFNDGTELSNKEFSDESGLEIYETPFRGYDAQLGRFWQSDPLSEIADDWSPYSFAYDNPVHFNDPYGLEGQGDGDSTVKPSTNPPPPTSDVPTGKLAEIVTLPEVIIYSWPTPSVPPLVPIATGGQPAPSYPLYPVEPEPNPGNRPGKVIDIGPPKPSIWPVVGRVGGTVLGVFLPTAGGLAGGGRCPAPDWYVPWPEHRNRRDNSNPHIVYTFTFIPNDGKTPVLKYGISDGYQYGLSRPERQLAALRQKYGISVNYVFIHAINREQALAIERQLVSEHVRNWSTMPREQIRPTPF